MPTICESTDASRGGTRLERVIDSLESISLAEMDSVALMNRVDTKFVLDREVLTELIEQVSSEYRVLEVEGVRISPYATLYFDTPQLDCYIDHHNGKLNRRKFRMRKYVTSGISFLEVKVKNNRGRTDKRRVAMADIEEVMSPESEDFIRSVTGESPELKPQIWTHFTRVTLVNRHEAERVTIDWNLDFRSPDAATQLPNIVIAEIKQESDNRWTPVRQQLRNLTIRPMRISKYCLGSMLLRPDLKHNRFKKKWLAIQRMA